MMTLAISLKKLRRNYYPMETWRQLLTVAHEYPTSGYLGGEKDLGSTH